VEDPCIESPANKLSKLSFMIKSVKEIMSPFMIRNIYFSKFQSLLWFRILFWGGIMKKIKKKYF